MSEANSIVITHAGRRIDLRREPRRGGKVPEDQGWSYSVDGGTRKGCYPNYTTARRAAMAEAEGK